MGIASLILADSTHLYPEMIQYHHHPSD